MELEGVAKYLGGMAYAKETAGEGRGRCFPFITISRESGAGGHSLTAALLKEFDRQPDRELFGGWQAFDRELCEKLAKSPKLKVLADSLMAEEYRGAVEDIMIHAVSGLSRQEPVIRECFEIMHDVADAGKSILVGRGGACLLAKHPWGIHLRLTAPLEWRLKIMTARLALGREETLKEISRRDEDRAALVRRFFRRDVADPLLYDAVFNTGRTGIEAAASAAASLVRLRAAEMAERAGRFQKAAAP